MLCALFTLILPTVINTHSSCSIALCSTSQIIARVLDDTMLSSIFSAVGNPSFLSLLGCHLMIHLKETGPEKARARSLNRDPPTTQIFAKDDRTSFDLD